MNTPSSLAAVLLAALTLAGCAASPVTRFHTLMAPPVPQTAAVPPASFAFEVLPVGVPAQADQPQLVVRSGSGEVRVLDSERWAAPLADELRAALAEDLTRRFGSPDVGGLPHPSARPVLRVAVQVRRFESVPGTQAVLEADWSLGLSGREARLNCRSRIHEPAGAGYPALVAAHQAALAALAGHIAATARQWAPAGQGGCPEE